MKTIKLKVKHNVYVTSEDVPGMHLMGETVLALHDEIPKVIKTLTKHNYGLDVQVEWISPTELAATELPNQLKE